ncbi:glycerophosphodiester phosphodiesterase [Streptomyces sp. JH14]|uniref:glycerophosphodiester phosphodiesterase n=1 Tax=Streptomyces sp. JH14 TaxID=2793630 RepID=UPI0023F9C42B|nr:glycerophosphodiester phosphodiesterase [Streptomyces sp. JH14]MDF6043262.1 glycerophosphodiester phosphodiesterase [Streptomyces sp. JH14]
MPLDPTYPVATWADLANLPAPRWIAHRGGRWLAPENTVEAYRMAAELGIDAIEIDVYRLQDGGLVVMHDSTADHTSNLTGSTGGLTTPAVLRGRIDAGTWFCNTWPNDLRIPLFADLLAEMGGIVPLVVHCNNAGSGAAAVAEIQRQERADSVLVMAWNETELAAARAAGIPTILLDEDGILSGQTYEGLLAAGTEYFGINPAVAQASTIQAAAAAGLKVIVYTVNRRVDYAALPLASVWAVISDDPWYARTTAPMRTRDIFSAQTYFHGMLGIVDGKEDRGQFQAPAWFGLDTSGTLHAENLGYLGVMQGYLGPLGDAFTLDFDFVLDAADSAGSSLQLALTTGDVEYDDDVTTGGARAAGYNILVRSNGAVDIFKTYGGTTPATKLGGVVSAALVPGTVYHLRVQVTPGQITATRTTIGAPNSVTVTDATYRGDMYPHLGVRDVKARWSDLVVS